MADLPVVYLAAPLSAPTRAGIEVNRRSAAEWACWIARTFNVAVECSWLVMTGVLEETPENRALGLACDIALVKRCDCLVAVGPEWSSGMRQESEHARAVVDWTFPDELLHDLRSGRLPNTVRDMAARLERAIALGAGKAD